MRDQFLRRPNEAAFRDIVQGYRNTWDARVFSNSSLYEDGEAGSMFPDHRETFGDTEGPIFFNRGCGISSAVLGNIRKTILHQRTRHTSNIALVVQE